MSSEEKESSRLFFDTHMHAYNLSHPSIGAMLGRILKSVFLGGKLKTGFHTLLLEIWKGKIKSILIVCSVVTLFVSALVMIFRSMPDTASVLFIVLVVLLLAKGIQLGVNRLKRILNLLVILDYNIGELFIVMEGEVEKVCKEKNENLKIALCPLMMDFSRETDFPEQQYKDTYLHYIPKNKPLEDQLFDLLKGIYDYQNYPLSKNMLEFYPFYGIEFHDQMKDDEINWVYKRYFEGLPIDEEERRSQIQRDLLKFPENTGITKDTLRYSVFAGFKVYPPLGFDPWPEEKDYPDKPANIIEIRRKRLDEFYRLCVRKEIPIMIHCGTNEAGTISRDLYAKTSGPDRWQYVLETYKGLKVCFAHFGLSKGKAIVENEVDWHKKIIELIKMSQSQVDFACVYTDISCCCFNEDDYIRMIQIAEQEGIADRIIYGTDFPMTSFQSNSYGDYIGVALDIISSEKYKRIMQQFCEINPYHFLFK